MLSNPSFFQSLFFQKFLPFPILTLQFKLMVNRGDGVE